MDKFNKFAQDMNIQVPDDLIDDYNAEYDRAVRLNDPLLMYILQRTAQEGFKTGPIGTDGYFEEYDPELNEDERENYKKFLDTYYPDEASKRVYRNKNNMYDDDEIYNAIID